MAQKTIRCNKGNWTSEEIVVSFTADGEFDFAGYKMKITFLGDRAEVTGDDWDSTLIVGYQINPSGKKAIWVFMPVGYSSPSRENADPYVAAIQVLCNIL